MFPGSEQAPQRSLQAETSAAERILRAANRLSGGGIVVGAASAAAFEEPQAASAGIVSASKNDMILFI